MGKMRTVEVKVTTHDGVWKTSSSCDAKRKVGRILKGSLRVSRVAHRGYHCVVGNVHVQWVVSEAGRKTGAL